jgi:hypothetical protein
LLHTISAFLPSPSCNVYHTDLLISSFHDVAIISYFMYLYYRSLRALSIYWSDRSDPNYFLCINGLCFWSMFLKYLAKMDLILMLSKFSSQKE